jgi:Domain of unknown function (DUF4388)
MALEGTIKDFGLPDIFQLIGLQRKTGLLTLKNEKEQVTVTFENGMVVMADSSAKRLEDRLGNVLVKQGKLSKERLDEALQTQKATLQRMGHILTTGNYITVKDLKDALQVQVSQIVFKVFRWRDGEYHFEPATAVDYDRDNFAPMSADFILMEGIRMVDEWPIIEKKIPSMDIVLRPVVDPSMIEVSGSADDPGDAIASGGSDARRNAAFNKIRLSAEEERVYRKVDGARTVQAIIDGTGLGEFEVCRTLFDLLNRNIIAPVGRGESREALAGQLEGPPSSVPAYAAAVVVAVLSLVAFGAHWNAPFAIAGRPPLLASSYEDLLVGVGRNRVERLDRAVRAYALWRGALPRTLEDLAEAGLVDRSCLRDPWARPFHFARTADGYILSGVDDHGKTDPATVIERALPVERP